MEVVRDRLLTSFGLRALSPDHPDYKGNHRGDLYSRDAAYHQGTVWPWLVGPFIDAWVKVYPKDRRGTRRFLQGLVFGHLHEACVGSISEIFDCGGTLHASRLCCSSLERSGGPTVLVSQLITGVRPSQPNITSMTSPESSFMKRNPAFPDSSTNGG